MKIPVFVIAFNNITYIKSTINQLIKLSVELIIIVDNNSTYEPLLKYYEDNNGKFTVVRMNKNYGHMVVTNCFYDILPNVFAITDPDLEFNENLPKDFLDQLYRLTEQYSMAKVGFALDISEPHLLNDQLKYMGYSIIQWESRFWKDRVCNTKYELYSADIDTTFAVYNKKYNWSRCMRVAKNFTAKHLPWYIEHKLPDDELTYYETNKITGTWNISRKLINAINLINQSTNKLTNK